MLLSFALLTGLITPPNPPASHRDDDVTVTVTIDSARHEVKVRAGPFFLPNMGKMDDHAMMDMGMGHTTPVYHFAWPVEGWMRGFRSGVEDGQGRPLPKGLMHHMIGVNYSRRQAIYPAAERLFGAGKETADVMAPATIGVPMKPGMDLGFYIMWHNDTGADLDSVYMTMALSYLPKNQNPRPVDVLPLYMDVNLTVGGGNTFDVPPGRSEKAWQFTLPVGGRLLGYGGHLHDYGVMVRLEDVATGKVLARVDAQRDASGAVTGVSRRLPGVRGAGLRLRADHPYRVVGVYDNPTGHNIINGAMAHISGIFAPDDFSKWPGVDEADPEYQKDLASLEIMGSEEDMDHDHGAHEHGGQEHNNR
jgi:hypothetical protein